MICSYRPIHYSSTAVYRLFILTTLALFVIRTAPAQNRAATPAQLARQIGRLLDDEQYSNAIWGVKIIDLSTGAPLYARNERISLMPASNAKLYTSAAVLDLLGPGFRYKTPVYTDGPIENGVLHGNLIVRGSGDPSIGGRYYEEEEPAEALRIIANTLKNGGLRVIEGDIIGDDDLFDEAPLGIGWSWDDEPYYYSAEISALSFYDNSVQFILQGQRPGMPARLRWAPFNTSYVEVSNRTITIPADSSLDSEYVRSRSGNYIEVRSEVPSGRIDTTYISVYNPTRYFVHVLRDILIQEGIAVKGRVIDVDDLAIKPRYDQRRLRQRTVYTSPPLQSIVEILNKESQNLYAELLIKTLGAHHPVDDDEIEPGSTEMGLESAMETFARAQVDTSRIRLVDGSGLSRMNLVTANMTASLLTYMWNHPYTATRQAFYNSLPIGGVDGTLEERFERGQSFRNVRAKTGTLTGASSLSGYVFSEAGTPFLFVLMCNNYTIKTSEVRKTQDEIVQLLATYPR